MIMLDLRATVENPSSKAQRTTLIEHHHRETWRERGGGGRWRGRGNGGEGGCRGRGNAEGGQKSEIQSYPHN